MGFINISCPATTCIVRMKKDIRITSKVKACSFSGLKIPPGRGIIFICFNGKQFLFLSAKSKKLHLRKRQPDKVCWTIPYRKAHKKDQMITLEKRKKRHRLSIHSYIGLRTKIQISDVMHDLCDFNL